MSKRTQLPVSALTLFALTLVAAPSLQAQHPEGTRSAPVEGADFRVYQRDGRLASFADILAEVESFDVVLVGEQHDDLIGHGFQASLLGAAFQRVQAERLVVLSLEMFERDVQYIVDEYLDGLISEDHFMNSARPWPDYEARYRPMVEIARAHGLPVVAANAP
ncbi:MAG: ChaN family lipoprotein, partial [Gemmatimonadales bacterium]|nr:ChaN family lipoprotein [Gemmatimonadales bacterium]